MKAIGTALGLALAISGTAAWSAQAAPPASQDFPKPLGYVSDHGLVLSSDWKERIRSVCKDLEIKTGVEMVVVTVGSIEPYGQVREYADALYRHWRIGTAQREHGVMVLAHTEGAQVSVTLGRNMIRVVSPALLDEVQRRYIRPSVQLGDFGEGLYRTAVAVATAAQDVRVGEPARRRSGATGLYIMVGSVILVVGFFWWITRPDQRHPFRRIQQGEYWGTGQGGFGGNFGGFGGATGGEEWSAGLTSRSRVAARPSAPPGPGDPPTS